MQFVIDNVDVNIATAAGHGTSHATGGNSGDDTSFPSRKCSTSASDDGRGSLSHWLLQEVSVEVLQKGSHHTGVEICGVRAPPSS